MIGRDATPGRPLGGGTSAGQQHDSPLGQLGREPLKPEARNCSTENFVRHRKAIMKFDLLFFADGCFTCGPEAYVCASPSTRYKKPDPRSGYILLTHESTSGTECHKQIDALINDLKKLKVKASRKFRNQNEL